MANTLGSFSIINDVGTFTLANNTTEQDVIEVFASDIEPVFMFKVNLDLSTLTNILATVTARVYYKVDGTNYRLRNGTGLVGGIINWVVNTDGPWLSVPVQDILVRDMKITLQSSLAQGGTRSIPYSYSSGK